MRAPTRSAGARSGAAAAESDAGKLPTVGVSSAVRRAFNAALHPRDGHGRFRQTTGGQQRPTTRRRGEAQERKPTVGEKALKTKGVTGNDKIEVLSKRVRKYQGFNTVEEFVAAHPKGRAYALRTLAADQKAGRIGFTAADGAEPAQVSAPQKDVVPAKPKLLVKDETDPETIPAEGTPGREFHDKMLEAANVFGDKAKFSAQYGRSGEPRSFQIDILDDAGEQEIGVIQRAFGQDIQGNKYVDHSIFMLESHMQGAGQAKKFLAQSVEAYKALGVDKVKLHANIDVGGYAWLKYGFKPDKYGVRNLTEHVGNRVKALHEAGVINDATKAHIERSVNFEDFSSIIEIGGTGKVEFEGKTQSLGKHIFLNSDWTGELDLFSRTSMQQFNSYIGGK